MNPFTDQKRSQEKILTNYEAKLEKLKELARAIFNIDPAQEPSQEQLSQVNNELNTLGLNENTSLNEYVAKRDEWIFFLNELNIPVNESNPSISLESDFMYDIPLLKRLVQIRNVINDPNIQSYEEVANHMYLLGLDTFENVTGAVIRFKIDERNDLETLNTTIFNNSPEFLAVLSKLPSSKLKDFIDFGRLKIVNNTDINNILEINDPEQLAENLQSLFYTLDLKRKQFGLSRLASSQEIAEVLNLQNQAISYLKENNEFDPNQELTIKDINQLLKEKARYEEVGIQLGLREGYRTKKTVQTRMSQLELLGDGINLTQREIDYARGERQEIIQNLRVAIAENPDLPPHLKAEFSKFTNSQLLAQLNLVSEAKKLQIEGQDVLMNMNNEVLAQRYRELGIGRLRQRTGRVSDGLIQERLVKNDNLINQIEARRIEMGFTQPINDYGSLNPDLLLQRQRRVENAYYALKALGINTIDPHTADEELIVKGMDLLGMPKGYARGAFLPEDMVRPDMPGRKFREARVFNPKILERRLKNREKLVKDVKALGKQFNGSDYEIPNQAEMSNNDLVRAKREHTRLVNIGKLAINKKDAPNNIDDVTLKDERRGLKNLEYGLLRRRFHKNIDPNEIKNRQAQLDPAQMWIGQEEQWSKKRKQLEGNLNEVNQIIESATTAGAPPGKIEELNNQKKILKASIDKGNKDLSDLKDRAIPYKRLIEADPKIQKARVYKQMFVNNIDPQDKISYDKIDKEVRHAVRDGRRKQRQEARMIYKISPFTRGFFARRRIQNIGQMKDRAKEFGFQDPDQLFRAGFLNRGVIRRFEHKERLINRAEQLGLNPDRTTAHELNVERRIHQFRLNRVPPVARAVRGFFNFGNRSLTSNQPITAIDPLKNRQQRFIPRRLAKAIGAPRRFVGKVINTKTVKETLNIGKGIGKGLREVATQLEKGAPEKK